MSSSSDDSLGASEDGGDAQERSTDLLASFYGIEKQTADADEDYAEPDEPLDRSDFEAKEYVHELLRRQPLDRLLERDDALRRETRTLGGDLQALVYENYSKFIAATETIQAMNSNVGGMEAGVACLDATMADVDRLAQQVNGSLAAKRAQIDTLVRSRRLLKRLEFLFELPARLELAVSEGRHEDAVQLYEAADPVLSAHAHVASLRDIHADAQRIVSDLKGDLQTGFASTDLAASGTLAARVRLLTKVGDAADAAQAQAAAVGCADRYLCGVLDDALRSDDAAQSLEKRVAALSTAFCGPRDAVRAQLDGLVRLPSHPVDKFVGIVETLVAGAPDPADAALALRAALNVDAARLGPVAAAIAAQAHEAADAELRSVYAKALDDLAAAASTDDAPALRAAPTNCDVALRRAARSIKEQAAPLEPFLATDDVAARTAKSEAWLKDAIETRGGRSPPTLVALAALCRLRGDEALGAELLARHAAIVGEDLDQKALDAMSAIATHDTHAPYVDACVGIVASAAKRVDAALRTKNVADIQLSEDAVDRRARALRTPRASGAAARSSVEVDVEKLFAKEASAGATGAADDVTQGAGVAAALLSRFTSALSASVRKRALSRDEYAQLERDARRLHAVLPRHVRDDRLRGVERGVMEFLEEAAERVVASGK